MLGPIRQLLHPAPFRIRPPSWPDDFATLVTYRSALDAVLSALPDEPPSRESHPPAPTEDSLVDDAKLKRGLLVDLGTGLWRLRQRLIDPATGEPPAATRKAYRHFVSIWETLQDAGVEVHDHTNDDYDAGHSLKVIAFQPTPGLSQDRVIETIRPSIYYKSERLQIGEVIVGTPVE